MLGGDDDDGEIGRNLNMQGLFHQSKEFWVVLQYNRQSLEYL